MTSMEEEEENYFQIRQCPVALHTLPLSVSRWVGRVLDQRSFEACKLVNDVYQDNNENTDHDEGRGGIV